MKDKLLNFAENMGNEAYKEERLEKWQKAFDVWKNDDSRIKEYAESGHEIVQPFNAELPKLVLIDSFIYVPDLETDSGLMSLPSDYSNTELTLEQETDLKSFPFVKVLWSPDKKDIGSVYTVDDGLAYIRYNEDHRKWTEAIASNPSLKDEMPRPAKFISGWGRWEKYQFTMNKFKEGSDLWDQHTFIVQKTMFRTKYTK